jgi:response regulator RpfG family c-di-GMP phosphodiesterase
MSEDPRPRILCVDDERNVLDGLARTLRSLFVVETANGGKEGLEYLTTKGPFAIVTSDLRMPVMDGIEFLSRVRDLSPATVRVLLTGQADMEGAIGAVNEGNVFRFLTKPCPTGLLVKSLMACVEQYRLVTSERVLLEQTLRGSVKALSDILALANPAAFGRATRVEYSVMEMMEHFEVLERWPVEVAAMLSQIGYVTLPSKTQEKVYKGEPLNDAEEAMVQRIPTVVEQLLGNIPRLELVREILRLCTRPFNVTKTAPGHITGVEIPWGARALRIALDYDALESQEVQVEKAFEILSGRSGIYDPVILEAFAGLHRRDRKVRALMLQEIAAGMLFGEDVKSSKGLLLIARGQEVTPSLLERVRNFSVELGIREPIRMIERPVALEASEVAPAIG